VRTATKAIALHFPEIEEYWRIAKKAQLDNPVVQPSVSGAETGSIGDNNLGVPCESHPVTDGASEKISKESGNTQCLENDGNFPGEECRCCGENIQKEPPIS
jgi:hypothetical protein